MDSLSQLLLFVLVGGAGLTAVALAKRHGARRRRALAMLEELTLTSSLFPAGSRGKLVGRVEALGQPLKAPLSGRACVYYRVRVEELRARDDHHQEYWVEICGEEEGRDFRLSDSEGQVTVELCDAEAVLEFDHHSRVGPEHGVASEAERALLERHGERDLRVDWLGELQPRPLRFHEAAITPGEVVSVLGFGTRDADGSLRLGSDGVESLILSDDPSAM